MATPKSLVNVMAVLAFAAGLLLLPDGLLGDRATSVYKCTIKQLYELTDAGRLKQKSQSFFVKIGDTFIVSLHDGRVIGESVFNQELAHGKAKVISKAGSGNSWIAYWEFIGPAHQSVARLEIADYVVEPRSQRPVQPPFLFVGPYEIATGNCE